MTPEQVETILQAHAEGISLRGISRIGKRAYGTVVDIVRKASYKAQLIHNEAVKAVDCAQITGDGGVVVCEKSRSDAAQKT